jgi:hypothetical protein
MRSPDRWLAVGGAIFGAGALLAISWLVYAAQSKTDFWSWQGISGVAATAIGFVGLVVGFVIPNETADKALGPVSFSLHAGPRSTNSQAGRDSLQAGRDVVTGGRPGENDDDS